MEVFLVSGLRFRMRPDPQSLVYSTAMFGACSTSPWESRLFETLVTFSSVPKVWTWVFIELWIVMPCLGIAMACLGWEKDGWEVPQPTHGPLFCGNWWFFGGCLGTLSFCGVPSPRAVVPLDRALNPVVLFERIKSVRLARVEKNVPFDALKIFLIRKSEIIISRLRKFQLQRDKFNSLLFWWSQSFLWRVWSSRAAAQLAAHWLRSARFLPFSSA